MSNPFFRPPGQPITEGQFQALVVRVRTHLIRRSAEAQVPDADLRATHPHLQNPAVWQRVKHALLE